jgi:hypothetical protein
VLQPAPPGQSFVHPSRKLARWLRFVFDSVLLIYFHGPDCCPREFLGIGSGRLSPVRFCFCCRVDFSLAAVFVHASVTRSRRFWTSPVPPVRVARAQLAYDFPPYFSFLLADSCGLFLRQVISFGFSLCECAAPAYLQGSSVSPGQLGSRH